MIWGDTFSARDARRDSWRPFFLLFPRILDDGRMAWLETIERRFRQSNCGFSSGFWSYRARLES